MVRQSLEWYNVLSMPTLPMKSTHVEHTSQPMELYIRQCTIWKKMHSKASSRVGDLQTHHKYETVETGTM